ncbi:MAG TPA: protein kinase, partial [Chroococcales cyanobacterium]
MDTFARQYEIAAAAAPAQQYIDPLRIKEGEIVQQRDLVGSVIAGRYKVLDLIAEGGMGAIYRVEHLSLGKALAMKVLGPEYMYNATARERFAVEAKSASCLQHANLVAVHDFSASENSLPYLVMDFVDGENLSTLIERERHLPWRKVVEFAIQICDGLNYAHNFGVV